MLRELSTKRIGFDKAAFVKTAAELLPVLCQAWDSNWALIEALLPAVAGGKVLGKVLGDGGKTVSEAEETVSMGTVCVKVSPCSLF